MKRINKNLENEIREISSKIGDLEKGKNNAKHTEFNYYVELIKKYSLSKELENFKLNNKYNVIYFRKENYGTSKYPNIINIVHQIYNRKFLRETNCYYVFEYGKSEIKIEKTKVICILVD